MWLWLLMVFCLERLIDVIRGVIKGKGMLRSKGVVGTPIRGGGGGSRNQQRLELLLLGRLQRRSGGTCKATFQEFEFPFQSHWNKAIGRFIGIVVSMMSRHDDGDDSFLFVSNDHKKPSHGLRISRKANLFQTRVYLEMSKDLICSTRQPPTPRRVSFQRFLSCFVPAVRRVETCGLVVPKQKEVHNGIDRETGWEEERVRRKSLCHTFLVSQDGMAVFRWYEVMAGSSRAV